MNTSRSGVAVSDRPRPWILDLTPAERSTLIATFGGWALDGMDVMVYSFVIPTLIAAWHISKGQAGMLGTAALLISAVGGWLAGLLADRFGRARVLQITILWFAVFTFFSGFTNSFWQLLIDARPAGPGLRRRVGGRLGADGRGHPRASIAARPSARCRADGPSAGESRPSAIPCCFRCCPPQWRGARCSGSAFFRRCWSSISGATFPSRKCSTDTRPREVLSAKAATFLEIFSPALLKITLLTALLATGVQGGYYAITTWLPTYLKTTRGLSVLNTGGYLFVVIVGSFVGYLVSAWLADRLGRKRTLVLFAVCSFVTVTAYTYLPISNRLMLVLGFPLGFFASGSFSPMGAFFTELFPSRLRGSGQGFSYNFGRGIGALFPTLVGFLSARIALGHAISTFAVAAYLVMILAVLLLPETRGKELQVYE